MRGGTGGMSGRSRGVGRLMQIQLTKLLALVHYETGSIFFNVFCPTSLGMQAPDDLPP